MHIPQQFFGAADYRTIAQLTRSLESAKPSARAGEVLGTSRYADEVGNKITITHYKGHTAIEEQKPNGVIRGHVLSSTYA